MTTEATTPAVVESRRMAVAERAWLIAVLRGLMFPGGPMPAPGSWPEALALAEREELGAAVALAFRGVALPRDVEHTLRTRHRENLARHLRMTEVLLGVLGALRAAGIEALVLKGPVLAETLYPHPALRPYSDLDILVRPEAVRHADDHLRARGWQRSPDGHSWAYDVAYDGQTVYVGPRGTRLDVHWRLLNHAGYVGGDPALWTRAVDVRLGSQTIRTLSDEDHLVFLAAHLVLHHEAVGLKWQWDLALLLTRRAADLSWEAVRARARADAVATAVWLALAVVTRTFGVPRPSVRGLAPGPLRRVLVRHLLTPAVEGRPFGSAGRVLVLDGARARWTIARRAVCPSPRWVRARYGGRTVAAYASHYRRLAAIRAR